MIVHQYVQLHLELIHRSPYSVAAERQAGGVWAWAPLGPRSKNMKNPPLLFSFPLDWISRPALSHALWPQDNFLQHCGLQNRTFVPSVPTTGDELTSWPTTLAAIHLRTTITMSSEEYLASYLWNLRFYSFPIVAKNCGALGCKLRTRIILWKWRSVNYFTGREKDGVGKYDDLISGFTGIRYQAGTYRTQTVKK